ncbi:MAG TPA: hypothetical protein VN605_07085 [Thermoanaerobaculia bacterium]|nr:hypothetical protein [Thermoanaerobaculia bacterium]
MILWPSEADERELAMRHRFANVRAIASGTKTPWQRSSPWIALLFFGLTLFAISATFGFFSLLGLPKGLLTAALCIGLAELLIQQRRMFGTGIESALWIGGLFAFLFGLPSQGRVEALLAFAAAAGLAGLRMRNPYFGTFSAILVVIYLAAAAHGSAFWTGGAALLALALTIAAAFGLLRKWSRPSTDSLLVAMVVVMPVAAYVTGKVLTEQTALDLQVAIVFASVAALLLTLGLARRNRALLIAGLVTVACVAIEVHELFFRSLEARLLAGGALLLVLTAVVSRALRGRTLGIVVTPAPMTQLEQVIQMGGAVAIAHPEPASQQPPDLKPGGGEFGGAGASGGF